MQERPMIMITACGCQTWHYTPTDQNRLQRVSTKEWLYKIVIIIFFCQRVCSLITLSLFSLHRN
jgi:hypothetical protein